MVREKKRRKEPFWYLDLPKLGEREPITDTIVMAVEFLKYQSEVAYHANKAQAISIASTVSTIGVGWSAAFYGIAQDSWITAILGFIAAIISLFALVFWTPRLVDYTREAYDNLGAAKFYRKWLADAVKSSPDEKGP